LEKVLEKRAVELEKSYLGIAGIEIISINFTLSPKAA
jgi:hypothetical protein